MTANAAQSSKKAEKIGVFVVFALALVVLSNVTACRRQEAETVADPKAATDKLAQAEKLYSQRDDLAKVRQAVFLARQARLADAASYEVAWELAEFDYYLGEHTTDERERDDAFRDGTEAAKTAVRLQPNKPEGHFWLGANYGGTAEHSMVPSPSSVGDIETEMGTVLKLREGFQFGSAYMVLGQVYLRAPRILGGDYQKAIENLEKGLRFGTNNSLLRLHLAEAYHAVGRDADARKQVEELLTLTPDPNYLPEHKEASEKSKKLVAQLKA